MEEMLCSRYLPGRLKMKTSRAYKPGAKTTFVQELDNTMTDSLARDLSAMVISNAEEAVSLKEVFFQANKHKRFPNNPGLLYDMFVNMKANEVSSHIDMYEDISKVPGRALLVKEFLCRTVQEPFSHRDFVSAFRVIRIYDYLYWKSPRLKGLSNGILSKFARTLYYFVDGDQGDTSLERVPGLWGLLSKIIILPPTVYDFLLFYGSMITLSKQQINDTKFLCFTLLHDPIVHKYYPSVIALAILDIVLESNKDIIYIILDQYCAVTPDVYLSCLTDLLRLFDPKSSPVLSSQNKCSKTPSEITLQISSSIDTLSYHKHRALQYLPTQPSSILGTNVDLRMYRSVPERGPKIGAGSYGTVYSLAKDSNFVMKELKEGDALLEFVKVCNLQHKNISSVSRICRSYPHILFYDRAALDLHTYVLTIKVPMDKALIRSYVKQLVTAVSYCHVNLTSHLDIKPSNIVIYRDGRLQLIDFGCASKFNPFIKQHNSSVTTFMYSPPEVLQDFGALYSDIATDIWSIGCCMAFMLSKGALKFFSTKGLSFNDKKIFACNIHNISTHYRWKEIIPSISPLEEDFLSCLLKYDPRERIDTVQALEHPYLKQ